MQVRETSQLALALFQPKIGPMQRMVYNIIKAHPGIDNLEISLLLNRPINTITGRTRELFKKHLITEAGKHTSKQTGHPVMGWRVV